jgi:hypothetical protein
MLVAMEYLVYQDSFYYMKNWWSVEEKEVATLTYAVYVAFLCHNC